MTDPHSRGASLRAVIAALCLFVVFAFAFAPHANAAGRHHWHHYHAHRHGHRWSHRRVRFAIDMRTGAVERAQPDIFASLFRPPAPPALVFDHAVIEPVSHVARGVAGVAGFIAREAAERGMNVAMALHVYNTEGRRAYVGDFGTSFGPFQLHYAGRRIYRHPGLGEKFTAATGLSARDPRTWPQQVIFALDYARVHGWGEWYGWQRERGWLAMWHVHRHHHRHRFI